MIKTLANMSQVEQLIERLCDDESVELGFASDNFVTGKDLKALVTLATELKARLVEFKAHNTKLKEFANQMLNEQRDMILRFDEILRQPVTGKKNDDRSDKFIQIAKRHEIDKIHCGKICATRNEYEEGRCTLIKGHSGSCYDI